MRKILYALAGALALVCAVAIIDEHPAFAQSFLRGNWAVNHTPAVNTLATASKAAATGTTHTATTCSGSITTVAAQTAITLSLRDGASGAGTVLWSQSIACAIGTPCVLSTPPINVPGTVSTAMTCEWSGTPVTGNFEVATLTGYDVR